MTYPYFNQEGQVFAKQLLHPPKIFSPSDILEHRDLTLPYFGRYINPMYPNQVGLGGMTTYLGGIKMYERGKGWESLTHPDFDLQNDFVYCFPRFSDLPTTL